MPSSFQATGELHTLEIRPYVPTQPPPGSPMLGILSEWHQEAEISIGFRGPVTMQDQGALQAAGKRARVTLTIEVLDEAC